MEPIWKTLQDAYLPAFQSPAFAARLEQLIVYSHKIERAFSREFLDGLWDELSALSEIETGEAFLCGLRAGAALTAELFPRSPD